jgi:hypothetical protein
MAAIVAPMMQRIHWDLHLVDDAGLQHDPKHAMPALHVGRASHASHMTLVTR